MSRSFTKLFSSITESTVWWESVATRVCWIAMLAMADRHGRVWASVPGLANRARISIEETKVALERFLAPDPYSRTRDHEGRRIEAIDGGWRLLNYAKYRAMRDDEERLQYKREWDQRNRPKRARNPTNPTKPDRGRPGPIQAEAEPEADVENSSSTTTKAAAAAMRKLVYPEKLASGQRGDVDKVLAPIDDNEAKQLLLDELHGATIFGKKSVREPIAFLKFLVEQYRAGRFVPSHAGRVQAEREGREVQTEVAAARARGPVGCTGCSLPTSRRSSL